MGCPGPEGHQGHPRDSRSVSSSRRGGMIQTAEQYQFLHHTLALYAAQLPGEPRP